MRPGFALPAGSGGCNLRATDNAKMDEKMSKFGRRQILALATGALAGGATPLRVFAQERRFEPRPSPWCTYELTTQVQIASPNGATRVWVPLPSVNSDYQQSLEDRWSSNASATRITSDSHYGAKMLCADFDPTIERPMVQLSSVVRTRNRAVDWHQKEFAREDAATLRSWTRPTALMPTDGIVLATAREAVGNAKTEEDKVQRIYDWVVSHTYREPKVRGCGVGDIKTMLETANFGGKCGDINGLFVGLNRAIGIPARDVYGIRLVPSEFGYRELGGDPSKLQGAQHCRAEVYLSSHGWVAMDPADVGKVMRQETPVWIKDSANPLVAPVNKALFGAWEGNWLAYNNAHDVALPGSSGSTLGFLMYPQAENANGRYDALDPENFKYTITARLIG
jgi:transglutaminase-like putative cysteine protease